MCAENWTLVYETDRQINCRALEASMLAVLHTNLKTTFDDSSGCPIADEADLYILRFWAGSEKFEARCPSLEDQRCGKFG